MLPVGYAPPMPPKNKTLSFIDASKPETLKYIRGIMKQLLTLQEIGRQYIDETKALFKPYYKAELKDIDAVEIINNMLELALLLNEIQAKHRTRKRCKTF